MWNYTDYKIEIENKIRDFIEENYIEYTWRADTLYICLSHWDMENFANILGNNLFDDGSIDVKWYGDGICVNMSELNNTFLGINLYNVFTHNYVNYEKAQVFWRIVSKINWQHEPLYYPTIDIAIKKHQEYIKDNYPQDLIDYFKEYIEKLKNNLKTKLDEKNIIYNDALIYFTISMGEKLYNYVLRNPEDIINYKSGDALARFEECFNF